MGGELDTLSDTPPQAEVYKSNMSNLVNVAL